MCIVLFFYRKDKHLWRNFSTSIAIHLDLNTYCRIFTDCLLLSYKNMIKIYRNRMVFIHAYRQHSIKLQRMFVFWENKSIIDTCSINITIIELFILMIWIMIHVNTQVSNWTLMQTVNMNVWEKERVLLLLLLLYDSESLICSLIVLILQVHQSILITQIVKKNIFIERN